MKNKATHILALAQFSLILAILMIQTFVPWLGYLPIGPFSLTLVPITVAVVASLLGAKWGSALGLSWGMLAWFRHLLQPSLMTPVFIQPLVSIVPRLLAGFLVGFVAQKLQTKVRPQIAYALGGALGAFANTFFVGLMIICFARDAYVQVAGLSDGRFLAALLGMLASNGVIEIIASMILVPMIALPLKRVLVKGY